MLVDHRRALRVSAAMLTGAVAVGVAVAVPALRRGVQPVDDAVLRWSTDAQAAPLVAVAQGLSLLGSTWVTWPVRVAAGLVLAARRRWLQLAALALAVVTSEALIGPPKAVYDRPRPPGSLIATSGASFPSGHAVASAVTAVGLVLVLLPPGRARWSWEVRAVGFAFLMALSRVYLRAHWLSDVVAGGLLGGGLAIGWPAVLQALRERAAARGASRGARA